MSTLEGRRAAALARLRAKSRRDVTALDRALDWPRETRLSGYTPDPDDPFEQQAREDEHLATLKARTDHCFHDPFADDSYEGD